MTRYRVAAILGCLYVAASVWIVRSEGEAHRAELKRTRAAAVSGGDAPGTAAQDGRAGKAGETAAASPRPNLPRVASRGEPGPGGGTGPAPARSAEPAGDRPPPPQAGSGLAEARPTNPPQAVPEPARPPAERPSLADPALDPLWNTPRMKAAWDLSRMGPEEEVRLGRELHDLVLHFNVPLEDGPWLRRVEEAAAPLLGTRSRKEIPYTFTVLDSDAPSAFSHPGGYVYVTRGFVGLIGEDEGYALEFALGHEIAHVDLKHALKSLDDPGVKKLGLGTLAAFYILIAPLAYPDDLEFEADAWVASRMKRLDRTRRETLAFLRKLEGYAKAHGFENGRKPPEPGPSAAENHLRAHPAAWKRLKRLTDSPNRP